MSDDRDPLSTILDWDSKFFGVSVARINKPNLNELDLRITLNELYHKKVDLVYWAADLSVESKQAAIKNDGIYVDRKITYVVDTWDGHSPYVKEYNGKVGDDLINLSIQSSEYSRFRVDPFLSDSYCDKLYEEWIKQSQNGSMGKSILVYSENGKNLGLITVGEKNGRGDIGLVAVSEKARGRKIGTELVNAAIFWFNENKYEQVQVITQGNNIPARRLYEKCWFEVDKIEEFYHFWS